MSGDYAERAVVGTATHRAKSPPATKSVNHRAAETCNLRSSSNKSHAATAVAVLKHIAQVGSEDIALDKRIAKHGDAHRAVERSRIDKRADQDS